MRWLLLTLSLTACGTVEAVTPKAAYLPEGSMAEEIADYNRGIARLPSCITSYWPECRQNKHGWRPTAR